MRSAGQRSRRASIPLVGALLALLIASSSLSGASTLVPPSGASACSRGELRSRVVAFTRAYDRGDSEGLEALFAPSPEFQWYSMDGPGRVLARGAGGRAWLGDYFARRHRRHDRLALTRFSFNGNSPHYGNFDFTMRRSTDGFQGGRPFPQGGKGAAVCDADGTRLIVLTFGRPNRLH